MSPGPMCEICNWNENSEIGWGLGERRKKMGEMENENAWLWRREFFFTAAVVVFFGGGKKKPC